MSYLDLLRESAKETGNIICMGLDPVLSLLPESKSTADERISEYFASIFKDMKSNNLRPAAFKPNIGYYTKLDNPRKKDFSGSIALSNVLGLLDDYFPGIPVILDSKRGDIAKSSLNYAEEAFISWGVDSVTVSPYMGKDSVSPFFFENKGVYILDRTSNPGSTDLQARTVLDTVDERETFPLYMAVAHKIVEWSASFEGLGAVVGATSPDELEEIAHYYANKKIALLIPGVGSQGGSASEVISRLRKVGYPESIARINSSSGLTSPWKKGSAPANYIELCRGAISALLKEGSINE